MRTLVSVAALLFCFQVQAACDFTFSQANLCAQLEWKAGPQVRKESQFIIRFSNQTTSTAQTLDGTLRVEFFMNMGHGRGHGTGSKQPIVEATDQVGEFLVKNVFLSMAGEWEARFFLTDANGQTERVVIPVRF